MARPLTLCAQTADPVATQALAAEVATCLGDGDLMVLTGDLGAGKTCFTQGLGAGLGVQGPITSPTFTLAAAYSGRLRLNHLDVYRLAGPAEAIDLDLPELLEEGVTVIEWGERIDAALPPDRLTVEIRLAPVDPAASDDRRRLRFELSGAAWVDRHGELETAMRRWQVPC